MRIQCTFVLLISETELDEYINVYVFTVDPGVQWKFDITVFYQTSSIFPKHFSGIIYFQGICWMVWMLLGEVVSIILKPKNLVYCTLFLRTII